MGRAEDLPVSDPQTRAPVILLVEDEVLLRMFLSEHLQDCGFHVFGAGSAAEAVEMIEHGSVKIDFVFSDVRMPGEMDGFGLSRWIKANRSGLPIVLTSAEAGKANLADELCAHQRFFTKPYNPDLVAAHIREVLAARKAAG
ncbi:MAG: response regulator [Burkholderiales bacterium]